ncbi:MAG: hypothetical protein H7Y59_13585 [Anaerolineales bacterium]|nr:hypothetical protein [Anaerolineales bacterium]
MENTQQTENKKVFKSGRSTMVIGVLIVLFTCIFLIGTISLDIFGEKAIGKLSNASTGCSGSKTCWTSKVEFNTKTNDPVAFYPMTFPILFDFDPFLSGRPYEEYSNFDVRYFESFPQIAKVKLAFFLEYTTMFCGLGIGTIVLLFGYLFSRPNKPFVIDLSKRK